MKKTSEDSLKKLFFPKFKLLNSGYGLSAGVNGICRSRHRRALQYNCHVPKFSRKERIPSRPTELTVYGVYGVFSLHFCRLKSTTTSFAK